MEPSLHLAFLSGLWLIYLLNTRKTIGKITFIFCLVSTFTFSLYYNGIINSQFVLDRERLFFVNSGFVLHINRFSEWSTYLPYRLRNLVFSPWIIPVQIFGRSLAFFWFDKAVVAIGVFGLVPLILAIKRRFLATLPSLIIIYASALAGSLSRDPNTSMIYFLVWPQLLTLIYLGLAPRKL